MGFVAPLNDKACLALAMAEARKLSKRPEFRRKVLQLGSIRRVVKYIRSLKQRDDLGDPLDGPRIACNVPQRLRFNASDPNCFERAVMFLAAAEILEPGIQRTLASLVLDRGWHTFPVEFRGSRPTVVVLDPVSPSHNTMLAAAYRAGDVSPLAEQHLVPWFGEMARNACADDGAEQCYDCAIDALRNGLVTGEPLPFDDVEDLHYVLERATEDAALWGGQGDAAVREVYRSIRNLSIKLDKGLVTGILGDLTRAAEKVAPQALKAALIAKFGPAAAVALQGFDVAVEPPADKPAPGKPEASAEKPASKSDGKPVGTLELTLEGSSKPDATAQSKDLITKNVKQLMRRMTLAFR